MIELNQISKRYGSLTAVRELSLHVPAGEFFALLGPNAAGKTTTLKILCGLLSPDSGSARLCGYDVRAEPMKARQRLAFVPDFPFLYDKLNPLEFLRFTGKVFRMAPADLDLAIRALVERFHLEGQLNKTIDSLSHGTRQRVALAAALVHDPRVIVIDEPMVGLDPQHARVVKDVLKERVREGAAVLLSTHQLSVAEEMADRIGIMHQGGLIAVGTRDELARMSGQRGPLEAAFLALTQSAENR
ncbi:MAG: ABC transporter ATP-binding protein [Verrucomicrobia bacterium]|jgi:ABC-2 type transport system ATP-binding protein|nr:ABC transporter ATP-binding protein [Verrucomicrobiota bacterium]